MLWYGPSIADLSCSIPMSFHPKAGLQQLQLDDLHKNLKTIYTVLPALAAQVPVIVIESELIFAHQDIYRRVRHGPFTV